MSECFLGLKFNSKDRRSRESNSDPRIYIVLLLVHGKQMCFDFPSKLLRKDGYNEGPQYVLLGE